MRLRKESAGGLPHAAANASANWSLVCILQSLWRGNRMNTTRGSGRIGKAIVLLVAAAPFAGAQTEVNLTTQSRHVDFSGASSTKPSKVSPTIPSICSTGEIFFDTSAAAGQNLYLCTAPNTW